jgi:CBS domain-containing protein
MKVKEIAMTKSESKPSTAAELMQRDVIVVYESDTLKDALGLMTENHITGLPVVDSKSRCVGVITASDILNYEQENADEAATANSDSAYHFDPDLQRWETLRASSFALENFAETKVAEVMSRDLIYVHRDTPLDEVAQKMVRQNVHRILVLNDEYGIHGIISAFDFVRLFAS